MAPTTCRGRSASSADQNRAPAETVAMLIVLKVVWTGTCGSGAFYRFNTPAANQSPISEDTHHDTAPMATGQQLRENLRQGVESVCLAGAEFESRGLEIGGDALPNLEPQLARRGHGVDAQQVHAAQDERHHRGTQLVTTGQSDGGYVA